MTIFEQLEQLYAKCPNRSLDQDLDYYFQRGYVFSGPTYLLIGKRIDDGWHIHVAIGKNCMQTFCSLMPFYLPFIGWAREAKNRDRYTWYRTEAVFRRLNMKLTPQQEFEKCRYAASNLVAQYRAEAPIGFDPVAMGGGPPSAPKPPAPPTKDDAAKSLLNQGKDRKRVGYSSTILTNSPQSPQSSLKTILGG